MTLSLQRIWRAFLRASLVLAVATPVAAQDGMIFAGVKDDRWGLWHRASDGVLTLIRDGEVRGPVARAGWLAFADPAGAIHIGTPDAETLQTVDDLPEPCGQPTLAPDGQTLVVACFRFANRQDDGALYRVSLPDLEVSPLYDGPGLQKSPAFSPDGQRIAFVTGFRLSAERVIEHIWMINIDGTEAQSLAETSDVNIDVDWQDDETVIFASDRGGDGVRLWQIRTDGSDAASVTLGPADMETTVDQTGWIAFVGLEGDTFRLLAQKIGEPQSRTTLVVTEDDGFTAAHDPYWTTEY